MPFTITTTAFTDGAAIPARYTCDADDVSPAFDILDTPPQAKSLALICDDPDAPGGTFVHWVLYDLDAETRSLPEGVEAVEAPRQLGGARQGKNDFGRVGFGGPCPPPGKPHRYVFTLHALDSRLGLTGAPTRAQLDRAMADHVLATARHIGTYQRARR